MPRPPRLDLPGVPQHVVVRGNNKSTMFFSDRDRRLFLRYLNRAYRRTGTLFEGRFKSTLVDTESYLFTCMRYIELNPVRAGLARTPIDYGWSSFPYNATGSPAWMLTPHEAYGGLGHDVESRARAYRALFTTPLSESDLETIRQATAKGAVLGGAAFEKKLEALLGRKVTPSSPGRPRRNRNSPKDRQREK